MNIRLPLRLARLRPSTSLIKPSSSAFSTTCARPADDPNQALLDALTPSRDKPSAGPSSTTSPPPKSPESRNRFLHGYPKPSPTSNSRTTTSTASPDTTTPDPPDSAFQLPRIRRMGPGAIAPNRPHARPNARKREADELAAYNPTLGGTPPLTVSAANALSAFFYTAPRPGDIYAPHDLSPAEHQKAKFARSNKAAARQPVLSRRRAALVGGDAFDALKLDPVAQYKNFAMLSEWVSETGRIRTIRELGVRRRSMRKLSKAVRRAVGLGIMPSVHRHPEMMRERVTERYGGGEYTRS